MNEEVTGFSAAQRMEISHWVLALILSVVIIYRNYIISTSDTFCWCYGRIRSILQPHISSYFCLEDYHEIVPGLYLGNFGSAANLPLLKRLNVSHVLTVIIGVPEIFSEFTYKLISIRDYPDVDILTHFPSAIQFIDEALRKNGKIFIHCMQGKSRSASIVCAWLMKTRKMTSSQALEFVHSKRDSISLNVGFATQLKEWQKQLNID